MSVLVWDGTTLASDSHANNGNLAFPIEKLWLVSDGRIAGAVGPLRGVATLREWSQAGMNSPFPLSSDGAQLLVVSKEKGVERYSGRSTPHLHGLNKLAIGEGAPWAYGALYMGATAEQAVAAAIEGCVHCNGQAVSMVLP